MSRSYNTSKGRKHHKNGKRHHTCGRGCDHCLSNFTIATLRQIPAKDFA